MNISVGILGIGSYLPEKVLTNADLEKMVNTTDEWIIERSGIKARHIAAPEQATSDMSIIAAQKALADAKTNPEEIDLVIVAHFLANIVAPGSHQYQFCWVTGVT